LTCMSIADCDILKLLSIMLLYFGFSKYEHNALKFDFSQFLREYDEYVEQNAPQFLFANCI